MGKAGWLAEPALTLLAASPLLGEKVSILHGISDPVLGTLYRRAMFTIYNSFYEGWGLPVTESLGHGRICVLPRHSALAEAGAVGGVFFEPQSEPDLIAKLEPLLFDAEARERGEALIAREVRLRDWPAITTDVLEAVRGFDFGVAVPAPARLPWPQGRALATRLLGGVRPQAAMAEAEAVRDGLLWHPLEAWGCWTAPGRARLRLTLTEAAQGRMRLYWGWWRRARGRR